MAYHAYAGTYLDFDYGEATQPCWLSDILEPVMQESI